MPVAATRSVLAYERRYGKNRILVALNMDNRPQTVALAVGGVLLSTSIDLTDRLLETAIELRPNEGGL